MIRQLRYNFNVEFNECYARKQQDIKSIAKKLARINQILPELDPSATPLSLKPYSLQPIESPKVLLTCTDEEIDVEKYLTPEQLAAMEEASRLEAERLRLMKLDNWRERGLEDMMGGVLEVRREDELKKDIPKPLFVREGKPESEWTEEEKRVYQVYLKACAELEEEREKYRKVSILLCCHRLVLSLYLTCKSLENAIFWHCKVHSSRKPKEKLWRETTLTSQLTYYSHTKLKK